MNITKAVIPAAGLGTRFLPLTKSIPKEMLPLLSKPAIQCIVEEGIASDIANFFIITSNKKPALKAYFKEAPDLDAMLKKQNKLNLIESLHSVMASAHINYVYQREQLGLGHALLMVRKAINTDEFFGIMLPDDIIMDGEPGLGQLIPVAQTYHANIIAVQEVPKEQLSAYGVISIKKRLNADTVEISHVVEKPKAEDAPSHLAIIGRYIFSSHILDAIDATKDQAVAEIQLTDGINQLIKNGERVLAYTLKGTRYDLGSPLGWLTANIHMGMKNSDFAPYVKKIIEQK